MRKETIGEKIVGANWDGDLGFLKKVFASGEQDVFLITESDNWNWLHRCNLLNPSPAEIVQFYVDKGVPVNAQDCYKMTPLHYAVRANNFAGAQVLLAAGADPNTPNQDDVTAFDQHFIENALGDYKFTQLMLSYGADPHRKIEKYGNRIKYYEHILKVNLIDEEQKEHVFKMLELLNASSP